MFGLTRRLIPKMARMRIYSHDRSTASLRLVHHHPPNNHISTNNLFHKQCEVLAVVKIMIPFARIMIPSAKLS
jgi:hypothetical protein